MYKATSQAGIYIVVVGLSLFGCGPATSQQDRKQAEQAEKANADSNANLTQNRVFQLAIEVEVSADGIKPLGASIVRAPAKSGSAMADLRIAAKAGDQTRAEYTAPDPRLSEVERQGQRALPSARTFLFVPLSAELTVVQITPVEGREDRVSKGGTFDPRPLARQACQERRALKECIELLGQPAAK